MVGEYRIDELARLAGTNVRNVRVYQDRGLLPAPRRDGRVGIYGDVHLARLRLIGQLLARGYTFANIGELVAVWERGGDLADILNLESALGHPWSDEIAGYVSAAELAELLGGPVGGADLEQAAALGVLERDGDRYRVPSPRLLNAGAELVAAGMTVGEVLALAARLRSHVDAAAREMAATVTSHVLAGHLTGGRLAGSAIGEVAAVTRRLRPLAQVTVDAMLAACMTGHLQDALGDHFSAVLEYLTRQQPAPGPLPATSPGSDAEPGSPVRLSSPEVP